MPTGYTAMIDDNPKMTATEWIMEGLARAFGICITLRDDSQGLTEKQILERLTQDLEKETSYHKKELRKATKEVKRLGTRNETEWKRVWQSEEKKKRTANKRSVEEADKNRERHERIRFELLRVLASDKAHKITKNIIKFGIDQLDLVKSDCTPYIQEPITLEKWIRSQIDQNTRDIDYHTKELAEAKERTTERINLYKRLKEDIMFLEVS